MANPAASARAPSAPAGGMPTGRSGANGAGSRPKSLGDDLGMTAKEKAMRSSFNSPRLRRRVIGGHVNPKTQRKSIDSPAVNAVRDEAQSVLGGMIKVGAVVRTRPFFKNEDPASKCVEVDAQKNVVTLADPKSGKRREYKVSLAAHAGCDQSYFYDKLCSELVDHVIHGLDCCVIASGAAYTGKTYTLKGEHGGDTAGLLPRALEGIFGKILHKKDYTNVMIGISYLEIYNEHLTDLSNWEHEETLEILDDKGNRGIVRNIHIEPVNDLEQAWQYIEQIDAHVEAYEREMNKPGMEGYHASAAHRIYTVDVAFTRTESDKDSALFGATTHVRSGLRFVDLGSSNIVTKIADKAHGHTQGISAREAATVNKSLTTLDRVVGAIVNKDKYVPYRDSALTRLLAQALGGECKTTFIGTIAPTAEAYKENVHTMEFMTRCQEALTTRQLPLWRRDEMIIEGLTGRIKRLRESEAQLVDDHQEELEEKEDEIEFLKKGFANELDRRKAACTAEKAALKAETDAALAAQKAELDAEVAANRAATEDVRTEMQALIATHVAAIEEQNAAHNTEVAKMRAEWDGDLEQAMSELEQKEQELVDAIAEAREGREALVKTHRKETDRLAALHQRQIDEHNAELDAAADELEAIEAQNQAQTDALKKQMAELKQENEGKLAEQAAARAADIEALEATLAADRTAAEQRQQQDADKFDKMQQSKDQEKADALAELTAATDAHLVTVTTQFEKTLEAQRKASDEEMEKAADEFEQLEARAVQKEAALEAKREVEISALKEEMAAVIRANADEVALLKASHADAMAAEHAKHADEIAQKEAELAAAEVQRQAETSSLSEQMEAMKIKLETAHAEHVQSLQSHHADRVREMESDHAATVDEMNATLDRTKEAHEAALTTKDEEMTRAIEAVEADKAAAEEIFTAEKLATQARLETEQTAVVDLQDTVDKLRARKDELKRALAAMTALRDGEQEQKNSLRAELVKVRQERDGYLADRDSCFVVLEANRQIRDQLVEAHAGTEQALSREAQTLTQQVKMAVDEIDQLHAVVGARRELAQQNEVTADEYRKAIDDKCAELRATLTTFRDANEELKTRSINDINATTSLDESDTVANCAALTAMATDATGALADIAVHCKETHDQLASRLNGMGSNASAFNAGVEEDIAALKGELTSKVDEVRDLVQTAETRVAEWSKSLSEHVMSRVNAVHEFDKTVVFNLSQLEAAITAMSSTQLANLTAVKDTIQQSAVEQRVQVNSGVQELSDSISAFVSNALKEFGQATSDSAFAAADKVVTEMDAASQNVEAQRTEIKTMLTEGRTNATNFNSTSTEELMAAKSSSTEAAFEVTQVLSKVGQASDAAGTSARDAAEALHERTRGFSAAAVDVQKDSVAQHDTRTSAALELLHAAGTLMGGRPATLSKDLSDQQKTRTKLRDRVATRLEEDGTAANTQLDNAGALIEAAEAAATALDTSTSFAREADAEAVPDKGTYVTPDELAATAVPSEVLAPSLTPQWSIEEAIHANKKFSGRGTDYPGQLGSEDFSGLVERTADANPPLDVSQLLHSAAADTDDEEALEPEAAAVAAAPEKATEQPPAEHPAKLLSGSKPEPEIEPESPAGVPVPRLPSLERQDSNNRTIPLRASSVAMDTYATSGVQAMFRFARAVADFPGPDDAAEDDDLHFKVGDPITVTTRVDEHWLSGRTADGQTGIFPQDFIEYTDEVNAVTGV